VFFSEQNRRARLAYSSMWVSRMRSSSRTSRGSRGMEQPRAGDNVLPEIAGEIGGRAKINLAPEHLCEIRFRPSHREQCWRDARRNSTSMSTSLSRQKSSRRMLPKRERRAMLLTRLRASIALSRKLRPLTCTAGDIPAVRVARVTSQTRAARGITILPLPLNPQVKGTRGRPGEFRSSRVNVGDLVPRSQCHPTVANAHPRISALCNEDYVV